MQLQKVYLVKGTQAKNENSTTPGDAAEESKRPVTTRNSRQAKASFNDETLEETKGGTKRARSTRRRRN